MRLSTVLVGSVGLTMLGTTRLVATSALSMA